MMEFLSVLWFFLIFVLIAGYFVLDGFDLGIGVLLSLIHIWSLMPSACFRNRRSCRAISFLATTHCIALAKNTLSTI